MTAKNLMDELIGWAKENVSETIDTCKAGDPERELTKVATCFIATPEVIRAAADWGADLLITHEPTYYDHFDAPERIAGNPVAEKKRELIRQTGMTIYRYHDHYHLCSPDGISEGVLRRLDWQGEFDGTGIYTLAEGKTACSLAEDFRKKLGLGQVRMVGDLDTPLKQIGLLLGACDDAEYLPVLQREDHWIAVFGEVCEWKVLEMIRDSAQLGFHRAALVLGHAGSERAGMEWLAERIRQEYPALETKYFECGEVYSYL